jgi:hypothetical protein
MEKILLVVVLAVFMVSATISLSSAEVMKSEQVYSFLRTGS